jgi:hypothetical protein
MGNTPVLPFQIRPARRAKRHAVTGMDWAQIDQPLFDRIVDTILGRLHGDHGHAPEGRGGDEGIDYVVGDNEIVYQYKFYPDGANTASRRRQIKRSFVTAEKHQPQEWVVVIPAKLLEGMRTYILGLSDSIKITIRDRAWLDNRLIDYPDLGEYFQYRTDVDYLFARAEALKVNPVFRNTADISTKTAELQRAIDAGDPDWTFDLSTVGGEIMQTLRAKDPNAPVRSPISISWASALPVGSSAQTQLDVSYSYGVVEPIRLSGSAVRDFKITGPALVAYEGPVDALELLPNPDSASPWANTDMIVRDADEEVLGTHLGQSRLLTRGGRGITVEFRLGELLQMLFRVPDDPAGDGHADFTTEDLAGQPIPAVLAVAEFVTQLREGTSVDFQVDSSRLMRILLTADVQAGPPGYFEDTRAIADDLAVIERETRARFRFPQTLTGSDRVDIRNSRLMLEGHVVAHPLTNQFNAKVNGELDPCLEIVLDGEPRWFKWEASPGQLKVMDRLIDVPEVAIGAPVRLAEESITAIRRALDRGDSTDGLPLRFHTVDSTDRMRLWLPDRFKGEQLWITPWDVPGIQQPAGTLSAIQSDDVDDVDLGPLESATGG